MESRVKNRANRIKGIFGRLRGVNKTSLFIRIVANALLLTVFTVTSSAAGGGAVQGTAALVTTLLNVTQVVIVAIGGGLAILGVINLLEGYGNDNAGAKSQGMKQLMAGAGVALVGLLGIPALRAFLTANGI